MGSRIVCVRYLAALNIRSGLLLALLCVAFSTYATESGPIGETGKIWAGLSALDFEFKEYDNNGTRLNHEHGALYGINIGAEAARGAALIQGILSYYSDDVRYDGQTQSGTPVNTRTNQEIMDGSAVVGIEGSFGNRVESALFLGGGYRNWERDIRSTGSASGLVETYDWWYGQAGAKTAYKSHKSMTWSADLRFTFPVDPEVKVKFKNNLDTTTLDLGRKAGYRLTLGWQYTSARGFGIALHPFYEVWKLGRSPAGTLSQNGAVIGTVAEPRSETKNRGVNLVLEYSL